jgi:trans-aconitate methyltransferase
MIAINKQIDAYLDDPDRLKYHSKKLIEIITDKINSDSFGEGLDIGCASGSFIRNLSPILTNYNFTGFDISKTLVDHANKQKKNKLSNFFVGDFNSISFDKKFNLICASGVLSIFQEFEPPLKKWLSWLSDDGIIFIFGRFNSRNIDTKILFRNNTQSDAEWEGGLSAFSIHTISRFLKQLGYKYEFQKFNLPIKLKEDVNNPIRTFTKEFENGERLIMDGANIVAEHFFLIIRRDLES